MAFLNSQFTLGMSQHLLQTSFFIIIFLHFRWKDPCPDLQGDALDALQKSFADVELLVIDEKSMVSALHLYMIDQRLRQAKPMKANEAFGGISVMIMGDFAQLPPVGLAAMFEVLKTFCVPITFRYFCKL